MEALARIKNALKDNGVLAYDPGQCVGECKAPYVVPRGYGNYPTLAGRRASYTLIVLHCLVPLDGNQNKALDALAKKAKAAMKQIRSQVKPTGNEGADLIESQYKALSRTVEYQVLKAQKE